jgi:UDP-MurNAc hydroxylase
VTNTLEMIGHATLRIHAGGKTLLVDPWFVDPIGAASLFHFPPLVHDLATVAATTDAIHLSHAHSDHFNRATLAAFPRSVPIYLGGYHRKGFRNAVQALGFRVIEVPFREPIVLAGTAMKMTLLEHDLGEGGYDSSMVLETPGLTAFANNDCLLRPETYAWIRERHAIDVALLGYSPTSFYPICFELPTDEKGALLRRSAERRFDYFLEAARLLTPALTVPYANGMRYLGPNELWKNVSFSTAAEAVERARALGLAADVLGPGDRVDAAHRVARVSTVYAAHEELAAIEAHARAVSEWVAGIAARVPAPRADLVDRFRTHVLRLWRQIRQRRPSIARQVIAYQLLDPAPAHFFFDFTRPDDQIFSRGTPARYDMRYVYPPGALQMALDGAIGFDDLHFADGVSIHQTAYAPEYYAMLLGELPEQD